MQSHNTTFVVPARSGFRLDVLRANHLPLRHPWGRYGPRVAPKVQTVWRDPFHMVRRSPYGRATQPLHGPRRAYCHAGPIGPGDPPSRAWLSDTTERPCRHHWKEAAAAPSYVLRPFRGAIGRPLDRV